MSKANSQETVSIERVLQSMQINGEILAKTKGFFFIKYGIEKIEKELDETVYAATRKIRGLNTISADDYADAVLLKNSFGRDTAEIYFNRFGGFDSEENYEAWTDEIKKVQEIVEKYDGKIAVNDCLLPYYFETIQATKKIPSHRVHVKIKIPGQDKLELKRGIQELVRKYETEQKRINFF